MAAIYTEQAPSRWSLAAGPLDRRGVRRSLALTFFFVALLVTLLATSAAASPALSVAPSAILALHVQRMVAAFVAGSALAVAGVLAQAVTGNPLADPGILGTSGGSFLGAKLGIVLTLALPLSLPLRAGASVVGALIGAALSLAILLGATRRSTPLEFLLTGFILSMAFSGVSTVVTAMAQEFPALGRALVMFAMGDLAGAGWPELRVAAPLAVGCISGAMLRRRDLDLLSLGSDEAQSLGLSVQSARYAILGWVACGTTAAVVLAGQLAFVGLLGPHLARRFVGGTHRLLVPAAAFFGGIIVLASDRVAVVLAELASVPTGAVTTLAGAPFFFFLLRRRLSDGPN